MLMILISTLSVIMHLICGNNQSWQLNFNLNFNIVDWDRRWFIDLNAGKTQLVSFNTSAIDVKMVGSVLQGKSSFIMLGFSFSSQLDWLSYIISIIKTASFLLRLYYISINLIYDSTWNTVVMLLVTTWNCWISYK